MPTVLCGSMAALVEVVVHDAFRQKVSSCAQPVLEIQPGEDLDIVW